MSDVEELLQAAPVVMVYDEVLCACKGGWRAPTVRELKRLARRDVARGVPICGFTGHNGVGKTMLAVQSAISDMAHGRPVYSTIEVHTVWGCTKPVLSLRQLLTLRDCTLLLDEVSIMFSSRATATLPPDIVTLLQSLRHMGEEGVTVRWTAPAWLRCDNLIREVTQAVVNVVAFLKKHDGSVWPRPRIMGAGLLDTTTGKTDETPTKVLRRRFMRPMGLEAFGAYDTHADITIIGRRYGGRCVDCGGSMEVPKHSQELHEKLGLPWYGDQLGITSARLVEFASPLHEHQTT